jgi:nucleoside-triphosphatase
MAIITGSPGAGKTMVCRQVIGLARAWGLAAKGVLTPPRYRADGRKVGIAVMDVHSGQSRALAVARPGQCGSACSPEVGPTTEGWQFYYAGLEWGAAVLASATPSDVLVVDELGPLELLRGEGWTVALDVLQAGRYHLAVVVVRPSLVQHFLTWLASAIPHSAGDPGPSVVTVTEANHIALPRRVLAGLGGKA